MVRTIDRVGRDLRSQSYAERATEIDAVAKQHGADAEVTTEDSSPRWWNSLNWLQIEWDSFDAEPSVETRKSQAIDFDTMH